MTFLIPLLLSLPHVHARGVDRITRVERIADHVATAIHDQLDALRSLDARLRTGELAASSLAGELDRLAADLNQTAAPARALIDRAPMSQRQAMSRAAVQPGPVASGLVAAGVGYVGIVVATGVLYHRYASPMFESGEGSVLHAIASVGVGAWAGTLTMMVLAESIRHIVKGLNKVRGISDQDRMVQAYFDRLARRGVKLHVDRQRLVPHPKDFGGSMYEDLAVIQKVARRLSERVDGEAKARLRPIVQRGYRTLFEDSRVVMAEVASQHGLLEDFPLTDLLTLGASPVVPGRCNTLLEAR